MSLLFELESAGRPVRLSELTQRLGWNKTTIFRLLKTLEELGAVRELDGRGYILGPSLIRLGEAAATALQLPDVARPHLQALHKRSGETVNLAVLSGNQVVIAGRVEGKEILGLRIGVGSALPSYCTSVGLVLLAGLDDEEVQRRMSDVDFVRRGPKSIGSMMSLLKRLKRVRTEGYAINDEELAAGHRAAAAPILSHSGATVAAINVSVPAARRPRKELVAELLPALLVTAQDISREVGWTPP